MNNNNINNLLNRATLNEIEALFVTSDKVSCEGRDPDSKHPKVYLRIPKASLNKGQIACPYCKQMFILKKNNAVK